jgi:hypothetical protein
MGGIFQVLDVSVEIIISFFANKLFIASLINSLFYQLKAQKNKYLSQKESSNNDLVS